MGLLRRKRVSPAVIDAGSATSPGPRPDNQDRCAVCAEWAVLSDGVGGQAGGARAAELTVAAVVARLSGSRGADVELMHDAVNRANEAVLSERRSDPALSNMAATLTFAVATSVTATRSEWLVGNVGDSPAWLVRADRAERVTEDHTLVAELVKAGAITPEAAATHPRRNVVVRAIGAEDGVTADVTTAVLSPGEALLLASDGLAEVVDPARFGEVMAGATSAVEAAERLVDRALGNGASDNVTAALLCHLASSGHDPARAR